jgi:ABC-type branched-subunit amino acid transport system substrate-binding protein
MTGVGTSPSTVSPSAAPGGGATASAVPRPRLATRSGPITIGALTINTASSFFDAMGINAATGDQIAMTRSVVAYLNRRGGIAGRQINLVVYDADTASYSANPSAETEAACTSFTQDHHAEAVTSLLASPGENFYECMTRHGVVMSGVDFSTESQLRRYPNTLYQPADVNYTRALRNNVEVLWKAGWLTSASKTAVIGWDTPDARSSVTEGLIPALRKHGLALTDQAYVSQTISEQSPQYQSAAFKFMARGVTHVFFTAGGLLLQFGVAAQSAGYTPKYALDSRQATGTLESTLPASQLRGSMGIGTIPYEDLNSSNWAKIQTPGRARCEAAIKESGQDLSQGIVMLTAMWICDNWFFLRDALAGAGPVDPRVFRSGAESLRSSFLSAATFGALFAPGRTHDAAMTYRLNAFDDSCGCFRYRSGPLSLQ